MPQLAAWRACWLSAAASSVANVLAEVRYYFCAPQSSDFPDNAVSEKSLTTSGKIVLTTSVSCTAAGFLPRLPSLLRTPCLITSRRAEVQGLWTSVFRILTPTMDKKIYFKNACHSQRVTESTNTSPCSSDGRELALDTKSHTVRDALALNV